VRTKPRIKSRKNKKYQEGRANIFDCEIRVGKRADVWRHSPVRLQFLPIAIDMKIFLSSSQILKCQQLEAGSSSSSFRNRRSVILRRKTRGWDDVGRYHVMNSGNYTSDQKPETKKQRIRDMPVFLDLHPASASSANQMIVRLGFLYRVCAGRIRKIFVLVRVLRHR
jgi:hypothetical protein